MSIDLATRKKVLLFLTASSAIAAIYLAQTSNEYFIFFKPLTTILVILIPILFSDKSNVRYGRLILGGLIFCLGGDALLLSPDLFVLGLVSFLIGHLLFTSAFISLGGIKTSWFPLLILTPITVAIYRYISPDLGELKIPVSVYMVVISAMCWQGLNLYFWKRQTATALVAIAVSFFFISDAILAINKFSSPVSYSAVLILGTYWLSITLLAASATLPIIQPRKAKTSQ